jgi:hypothetical protein
VCHVYIYKCVCFYDFIFANFIHYSVYYHIMMMSYTKSGPITDNTSYAGPLSVGPATVTTGAAVTVGSAQSVAHSGGGAGGGSSSPLVFGRLECRKCNLHFSTREQMAVHLRRFCVDSIYGDSTKVKQLAQQYKQTEHQRRAQYGSSSSGVASSSSSSSSSASSLRRKGGNSNGADGNSNDSDDTPILTFDDVKTYLQSSSSNPESAAPLYLSRNVVGNFTLSELRRRLNADERTKSKLESDIEAALEHERIDELKVLQKRRKQAWQKRFETKETIREHMAEMEQRRKQEVQARVEASKLKQRLAGLDREYLVRLEQERRRELQQLVHEREQLQAQERDLLGDIEAIESKVVQQFKSTQPKHSMLDRIEDQDSQLNGQDNSSTAAGRSAQQQAQHALKVLRQKAEQHGRRTAEFQMRREQLNSKLEAIQSTLKDKFRVTTADMSSVNTNLDVSGDRLKESANILANRVQSDQQQLDKLKNRFMEQDRERTERQTRRRHESHSHNDTQPLSNDTVSVADSVHSRDRHRQREREHERRYVRGAQSQSAFPIDYDSDNDDNNNHNDDDSQSAGGGDRSEYHQQRRDRRQNLAASGGDRDHNVRHLGASQKAHSHHPQSRPAHAAAVSEQDSLARLFSKVDQLKQQTFTPPVPQSHSNATNANDSMLDIAVHELEAEIARIKSQRSGGTSPGMYAQQTQQLHSYPMAATNAYQHPATIAMMHPHMATYGTLPSQHQQLPHMFPPAAVTASAPAPAPAPAPASTHPMMNQMQQLLQQHEVENQRLQTELENIQNVKDRDRLTRAQRGFENTLSMLTSHVSQLYGRDDSNASGDVTKLWKNKSKNRNANASRHDDGDDDDDNGNGNDNGDQDNDENNRGENGERSSPSSREARRKSDVSAAESEIASLLQVNHVRRIDPLQASDSLLKTFRKIERLPRNSPFRKMQVEHLLKVTQLQLERDQFMEESELERLRTAHRVQLKLAKKRQSHEQWKMDQQRRIEELMVAQRIAEHSKSMKKHIKQKNKKAISRKLRKYNPQDGFTINWDFMTGLKKRAQQIAVVYQVLAGSESHHEAKSTGFLSCKADGPQKNLCLMSKKDGFSRVPALTSIKLILEVQYSTKAPSKSRSGRSAKPITKSFGWTIIELFGDEISAFTAAEKARERKRKAEALAAGGGKNNDDDNDDDDLSDLDSSDDDLDDEYGGTHGAGTVGHFQRGRWKLPLFKTPIDASATAATIAANGKLIEDSHIYLSLWPAAEGKHVPAGADPALTKHMYAEIDYSKLSQEPEPMLAFDDADDADDGDDTVAATVAPPSIIDGIHGANGPSVVIDAIESSAATGGGAPGPGAAASNQRQASMNNLAAPSEIVGALSNASTPAQSEANASIHFGDSKLNLDDTVVDATEDASQNKSMSEVEPLEPEPEPEPEPELIQLPPITAMDYDDEDGIGLLLEYCDRQDITNKEYSRIRATVYVNDRAAQDLDGKPLVWSSSYAQSSLNGELGMTQWQQRHAFQDLLFQPNTRVVLELLQTDSRPDDPFDIDTLQDTEDLAGWCILDMFQIAKQARTAHVNVGSFQLHFEPAPVSFAHLENQDDSAHAGNADTKRPESAASSFSTSTSGGIGAQSGYDNKYNSSPLPEPQSMNRNTSICQSSVAVQLYVPTSPPAEKRVAHLISADDQQLSTLPWIMKSVPLKRTQFEAGDGFDVYIDGGRFLPDGITITRVTLMMMTNELRPNIAGKDAFAMMWEHCNARGKIYEPTYNLRQEFRANAFNATTTAIVRLDALDRKTQSYVVVGYSAINMFVDCDTKRQPLEDVPGGSRVWLNEGNFQLPVVYTFPRINRQHGVQRKKKKKKKNEPDDPDDSVDEKGNRRTCVDMFDSMSRVPVATVLVRIRKAARSADQLTVLSTEEVPEEEWEKKGLVENVPASAYAQKLYDSTRSIPNAAEQKLYNHLKHRPDSNVMALIPQLLPADSKLVMETEDDYADWMFDQMNIAHAMKHWALPRFDMNQLAKFNPAAGFKVHIDACHNVHQAKIPLPSGQTAGGKDMPFVIYSLSPPGSYYQAYRLTDGVQCTKAWDMDSLLRSPHFVDSYNVFKDVRFNPNMLLIVDVREVVYKDLHRDFMLPPACIGWTVLPLFTHDGYVRTGSYQLPLFKGEVRYDLVNLMHRHGVSAIVQEALTKKQGGNHPGKPRKKKKNKKKKKKQTDDDSKDGDDDEELDLSIFPALQFIDSASTFVRLVDQQRAHIAPAALDMSAVSHSLMLLHPKIAKATKKSKTPHVVALDKFAYDPAKDKASGLFSFKKGKPLSSTMHLGDKDTDMYIRKTVQRIARATGIDGFVLS